MRKRDKVVAVTVAGAVVVAGGVAALSATGGSSGEPTNTVAGTAPRSVPAPTDVAPGSNTDPAGVAILKQPRATTDALPAALLELPLAARIGAPDGARRATTADGTTVFVVPGQSAGAVCVIGVFDEKSNPPGSYGTCGSVRSLQGSAIAVSLDLGDGTKRVIGAVANDITSVRATIGDESAKVEGNAFVLRVPSTAKDVEVVTASGEKHSVPLS